MEERKREFIHISRILFVTISTSILFWATIFGSIIVFIFFEDLAIMLKYWWALLVYNVETMFG